MAFRPTSARASAHRAARGRPPREPDREWALRALGRWYDDSARDLPWRRTTDPYAIWISEIMPPPSSYQRLRWADPERLALSTLARRVLAEALERREGGR